MEINGKMCWIFHGDVFDITMQHSKWLAKFGSFGYDLLILLNSFANFILTSFGRQKISFSQKIKHGVKRAVSYINKFEETAAGIAISKGYAFVICGHIHQPEIRTISNHKGSVTYLNSGDWVENLSALEYHEGEWKIYRYHEDPFAQAYALASKHADSLSHKETFAELLKEFELR